MAHYLLSAHSSPDQAREPMTAAQVQGVTTEVRRLEAEMRDAGAWVFGGRLADPDTATVVRVAGGEVLTTDGPFLESKEHLGGFYLIAADDLDAALAWAAKVTVLVGAPIEVRPFQDENGR